MRIFIFLALLALSVSAASAQLVDTRRIIKVTGSSSLVVTPDIIPVHINIREYYEEEFQYGKYPSDYKTLVTLESIERDLMSKIRALGIADTAVKVEQLGTTWRPYWDYNNDGKNDVLGPMLRRKNIIVTLNNLAVADKLLNSLSMNGVDNISLGTLRHSKEQEHRKQVKIAAMKAAREKAQYLVESVGAKLGQILNITEVNDTYSWYPRNTASNSAFSNTSIDASESADVQVRDITVRYEMEAMFEIQ